jgi:hypothetical protein
MLEKITIYLEAAVHCKAIPPCQYCNIRQAIQMMPLGITAFHYTRHVSVLVHCV